MTEGLMAVCLPYGYSITLIFGYLKRISGDEYELYGQRLKTLKDKTPEEVISDGTDPINLAPVTNYQLHRLQILSAVVPGKAWEKLCPIPKN